MAVQSITFGDKVDLNTTAVADINKIKASDLNEIKTVVNTNATELTNVGTYSTTEVNTGKKWINDKPIYRKVLSFTTSSTLNSFINVAHSISNVDVFLPNIDMAVFYNNNWYKCPNDIVIEIYANSTNFSYYNKSQYYASKPAFAILEYTKTTD